MYNLLVKISVGSFVVAVVCLGFVIIVGGGAL